MRNSLSSNTRGSRAANSLAEFLIAQFLKEAGILVADHGDAGGGRNHNAFGVLVEPDKALGLRKSFGAEAGVGVHLSAAGLRRQKVELDAQPLKQPHHGSAGFGKERVVIAGDEERCAHPRDPSAKQDGERG